MPLYHIQDSDRPLWIVAPDWATAIEVWKRVIEQENDGAVSEPDGVSMICDDDDIAFDPAFGTRVVRRGERP
jgi:hypothetical protein